MLALSLLLGAAGVKAMLGIKVSTVQLSDNEIFCSDNCAFSGTYFGDDGSVCPEKEIVVQLDDKGVENPEPYKYVCAEAASKTPGWSVRPRKNGEEPPSCDVQEVTKSLPMDAQCISNKQFGSSGKLEVAQWSDLKKQLELASAGQEGDKVDKSTSNKAPKQENTLENLKREIKKACCFRALSVGQCRRAEGQCIHACSQKESRDCPRKSQEQPTVEELAQCVEKVEVGDRFADAEDLQKAACDKGSLSKRA
ncbi:hypothetical protein X797_012109 [Metarhizium robertsii]|uniref:Uncharacterized protein n=2 Tax=Metarhizium robertsii TaxID=568076 RepID=E9EKA3_METRA|nr:uncharacterized protein MAA_00918 [Metarhizium robertsii ARSEF 23]EFZ03844.1 hypothetical protein MAA_00918 [Metarhizium robertsii ARSEF 23]EXU94812.1 hypothetical protein X797_012109 [Metarhizium robertsii]